MCTLIVAHRVWGSHPLVVAANRDEQLDRPALGPTREGWGGRSILAPRDLQAGGTWLGINAARVFAAITNRHAPPRRDDARSRGLLVLDALEEASAEAAAERVRRTAPTMHNPFHLIVADRSSAHLVWNDGTTHHAKVLPPGIHVVTERSFGAAPTRRIERLQQRLAGWDGRARPPTLAEWTALLGEHDEAPLEGVCLHAEALGYGTRSSTVLELADGDGTDRLLHADGPPCRTAFVDFADALAALWDDGP